MWVHVSATGQKNQSTGTETGWKNTVLWGHLVECDGVRGYRLENEHGSASGFTLYRTLFLCTLSRQQLVNVRTPLFFKSINSHTHSSRDRLVVKSSPMLNQVSQIPEYGQGVWSTLIKSNEAIDRSSTCVEYPVLSDFCFVFDIVCTLHLLLLWPDFLSRKDLSGEGLFWFSLRKATVHPGRERLSVNTWGHIKSTIRTPNMNRK